VRCHGFLDEEAYLPLVARAHAALGTLALHRKRMREACPLKLRRYLAYGLPSVIGHLDTDFADATRWFLLRLPNTETNVRDHQSQITAFVEAVKGRRVARNEVEDSISAAVKEARRIEFFERVLGR